MSSMMSHNETEIMQSLILNDSEVLILEALSSGRMTSKSLRVYLDKHNIKLGESSFRNRLTTLEKLGATEQHSTYWEITQDGKIAYSEYKGKEK